MIWAAAVGQAGRNGLQSGGKLLLASTAFVLASSVISSASLAHAQSTQQISFAIPAGPLDSALTRFGASSGIQVLYDSSVTAGRRTSGISDTLPPEAALGQLLGDTGLTYRFTSPNSVTIETPFQNSTVGTAPGDMVLDTIMIQGALANSTLGEPPAPYAGGQVATGGQLGMLGNRDVMDTPFSQTSYTGQLIQDQQAQTVNEVLNNNPSVLTTSRGARHDVENIRGFQQQTKISPRGLNGLGGIAPVEFASADFLERVEVLNGPSALVNGLVGAGHIGGSVNLVTKRATDEPITELTTRYVSDAQVGAHIDFGRRFGADNEFGIRFNGSGLTGDTPVDTQSARDAAAALNFDYQGERFRFSTDLAYQSQDLSPSANTITVRTALNNGTLTQIPRAPDASRSLFPSWEDRHSVNTLGMAQAEFDITDDLTAYAAIGGQRLDEDLRLTGPAVVSAGTDAYRLLPWYQRSYYDVLSSQGGLRGSAQTGAVRHDFSVNATFARHTEQYSSVTLPAGDPENWIDVPSLYDPVFGAPIAFPDTPAPVKRAETTTSSIGFADTLSFLDERIQLTAGLRYQKVEAEGFDALGAQTSDYDNHAWTPAVGLVVKPWENVSVYASYTEGLQPGTTVGPTYANAGEVFAPYVSKQYEAGVKIDWGSVATSVALFQIAQPNAIVAPGNILTLDGEQRNRGVELSVSGEVLNGVRMLGGITFLDARQTNTANGSLDGARAYAAPKVRAVIGAEWDTPFVEGLTLSGRLTYTGDQVVINTRPDVTIPSWTQVDLGARYTFTSPWNEKPVTVRFNVDNVFNESYWKVPHSQGMVQLSEPRTFRLSTSYKF